MQKNSLGLSNAGWQVCFPLHCSFALRDIYRSCLAFKWYFHIVMLQCKEINVLTALLKSAFMKAASGRSCLLFFPLSVIKSVIWEQAAGV